MLTIAAYGSTLSDLEKTVDIRLPKIARILDFRISRPATTPEHPTAPFRMVAVHCLADLDQPRTVRRFHVFRGYDEIPDSLYWRLKFVKVVETIEDYSFIFEETNYVEPAAPRERDDRTISGEPVHGGDEPETSGGSSGIPIPDQQTEGHSLEAPH